MAIIFGPDPNDSEPDGSAPDNWTKNTTYPPDTFEIDDNDTISPYSGTKCIKLFSGASSGYAQHDLSSPETTEPVFVGMYVNDSTDVSLFVTQDTTGDLDSSKMATYLKINGGNLQYFDGSSWNTITAHSSGWIFLKIVHNFVADTFDIWEWTGSWTSRGIDLDFRNACTDFESLHIGATPQDTIWYDVVQIGEAEGWPGGSPVRAGSMCGVG